MSDHSLFQDDFHISHLREIFPNERWVISWILHWFPSRLYTVSLIFHILFSISLIAGVLRFSDLILKNMEWSVLAVFVSLFSLYNINVGSNELYYNMFVASLTAKSVGIWAVIFFYQKKYLWASLVLALTSIFHPVVGLQLFVIFIAMLFLSKMMKWEKVDWRSIAKFFLFFLVTGGLWIVFFLVDQEAKVGSKTEFFDIVQFRMAHHFFPSHFPKSHIIVMTLLVLVGFLQFNKRSKFLFSFYTVAVLGIIAYLIGMHFKWNLLLSSQWMKVTIWLKFFSVLAVLQLIQKATEKKYHRLIFMVGFIIALLVAMLRFNPRFDTVSPIEMYAWVESQTARDAVFLVPPELVDFKAKTRRSSYFDFKAMLHHQPAIFDWADRFEEVYGLEIGDRPVENDIFSTIRKSYGAGSKIINNEEIDYFIAPNNEQYSLLISRFEKAGKKRLFLGQEYIIYGEKESFN